MVPKIGALSALGASYLHRLLNLEGKPTYGTDYYIRTD